MVYVKNKEFEAIAAIDDYISFIWTERYFEAGDFELVVGMSSTTLDIFKKDFYIFKDDTDVVMIIETLQIGYTVDDGYVLTVSGRSLESILDRRIINKTTVLDGKVQEAVVNMVHDQFLYDGTSTVSDPRAVERFTVLVNTSTQMPPDMTDWRNWTISNRQFTGDNLYDVVTTICYEYGLGFKIRLVDGNYQFSMYNGTDHSGMKTVEELYGRPNASSTTYLYNDDRYPRGTIDEGILSFMIITDESKINIGGYGISDKDCIKVFEHNMYYYDGKAKDKFKFSFVCPADAYGFTIRVGKPAANFYCDVNGGYDGAYDPYNSNALTFKKDRVYEVIGEVQSREYWPPEPGQTGSSFDVAGWVAKISSITSRVYNSDSYPITFSEEYDNLISSSYIESNSSYKNVAYVAGEGEGIERTILEVHSNDASDTDVGLYRRELFVDARDLQSVYYDASGTQVTLTSSEYGELLQSRGIEKLSEVSQTSSFEAEVDTAALWTIKTDYDVGDIVRIDTAYGVRNLARVTEIVYSIDSGDSGVYPGFELL